MSYTIPEGFIILPHHEEELKVIALRHGLPNTVVDEFIELHCRIIQGMIDSGHMVVSDDAPQPEGEDNAS